MPRVFVYANERGMIPFRGSEIDPYLFTYNFLRHNGCDIDKLANGNGFKIDDTITRAVINQARDNQIRYSWRESMHKLGLDTSDTFKPSDYQDFGLRAVSDSSRGGRLGYLFEIPEETCPEIEELSKAGIEHTVLN